MDQLSIIVRDLTNELNDIAKEIEICKNSDEKITLLFRAGVILEKIQKIIKGKSVDLYIQTENK